MAVPHANESRPPVAGTSGEWYNYVTGDLPDWRQPQAIDAQHEAVFANTIHRAVAAELTSVRYPRGYYAIVDGGKVDEALERYYTYFPATEDTPEHKLARHTFQRGLEDVINDRMPEFAELQVVSGICKELHGRALHDARYKYASRAAFGLLFALGMAIEQTEQEREAGRFD